MSEKNILYDVHCHLHHEKLYRKLEMVLLKAQKNKINIVAVSMDADSSRCSLNIAKQYNGVYAAIGLHPWQVNNVSQVEEISDILQESRNDIVAIGEIGLDHTFIKDSKLWKIQEQALEQLIALALRFDLPLITHGKGVESGLVEFLIDHGAENVILHWFLGDEKTIKRAIAAGYYFSITPAIIFQSGLRLVVDLVPLDRLMLESDGPVQFKKLQGSPSVIPIVAEEIARIKHVSLDHIERMTTQTARHVFRIENFNTADKRTDRH